MNDKHIVLSQAKVPKNETEEERAARLEMESLAGEERQRRDQVQ
jgi:hypothetical protein